jgi:hypothetical protein
MAKILLKDINIQFPITYNHDRSLRNKFIKLLKYNEAKFEFKSSLKNINIEVNNGDVVGIIFASFDTYGGIAISHNDIYNFLYKNNILIY